LSSEQLKVIRRAQKSRQAGLAEPGSVVWWFRVVTVVLFVFHINYAHFHLLSEEHFDSCHDPAAHTVAQHHDGHDDDDDDDDHGGPHHKPHPAQDHLVQMLAKHQDSALVSDLAAVLPAFCLTLPVSRILRVPLEHWVLPGESPPDPLQPRAPPLS
jgi:hypothetical protein